MPKPKKDRYVMYPPQVVLFKPQGIPAYMLDQVVMSVDEYEAIRLIDSLGLDQEQAAKKMRVSRATCARIIESARKKSAEALTQGKAIRIEGGSFVIGRNRYRCRNCGTLWQAKDAEPEGDSDSSGKSAEATCPQCASTQVVDLGQQVGWGRKAGWKRGGRGQHRR
jgi:predicted DNA-binding protein (UPF0251 family)